MKINALMTLVCMMFLLSACSLNSDEVALSDIPEEIKSDFELRFPDTRKVKWEQEGDFWEAEFKENGVEVSIIYDLDYNWVRTEREISIGELPESIITFVSENYPGGKVDEAESFESSGENGFIVEIEMGKTELELFFSLDGAFLREVLETGDDNDD